MAAAVLVAVSVRSVTFLPTGLLVSAFLFLMKLGGRREGKVMDE